MLKGMAHAHSGLRWFLLIMLVVSIFSAYKKWKGNEAFTETDNKYSLITFILAHIQLLIGMFLYFKSTKVNLDVLDMSNSIMRFFTVEHLGGMLIAIILITLGRIQSKKITDDALKHKKIFVMFLIALILILVSIPWPFRDLGSGWF